MKQKFSEAIKIPEGIICVYESNILKCKKDNIELERLIDLYPAELKLDSKEIKIECSSANKKEIKYIRTIIAHINNLFSGLNRKFVYHLESASVHFPMTLKREGSKVTINNFLGEKVPRIAKILPNVDVEIKGAQIIVSSYNKESAGQTAANLEKATKIKKRDRRIFQDGVYITSKASSKFSDSEEDKK